MSKPPLSRKRPPLPELESAGTERRYRKYVVSLVDEKHISPADARAAVAAAERGSTRGLSDTQREVASKIAPLVTAERNRPREQMEIRAMVDAELERAIADRRIARESTDLIVSAARLLESTGNRKILEGLPKLEIELIESLCNIMAGRKKVSFTPKTDQVTEFLRSKGFTHPDNPRERGLVGSILRKAREIARMEIDAENASWVSRVTNSIFDRKKPRKSCRKKSHISMTLCGLLRRKCGNPLGAEWIKNIPQYSYCAALMN